MELIFLPKSSYPPCCSALEAHRLPRPLATLAPTLPAIDFLISDRMLSVIKDDDDGAAAAAADDDDDDFILN